MRVHSKHSGGLAHLDPDILRHSTAHVMAAAVCRLFEDVKLDIGPATDSGFYYDFDLSHRLAPEDFPSIEREMARIVAEDLPFECLEVGRSEAQVLSLIHISEPTRPY